MSLHIEAADGGKERSEGGVEFVVIIKMGGSSEHVRTGSGFVLS